jgi:hypothetical protein
MTTPQEFSPESLAGAFSSLPKAVVSGADRPLTKRALKDALRRHSAGESTPEEVVQWITGSTP